MTVTEALKIGKSAPRDAGVFGVCLACGFTPLHLRTFLIAHLQQLRRDRRVEVSTGLYGDLAGTVESAASAEIDAFAIAIEWSDLDPRLGHRSSGAWTGEAAAEIAANVRSALSRVANAILNVRTGVRVAVSLPTLPMPPLFHTPGWQTSNAELLLERDLLDFSARILESGRVAIVNANRLAEESMPAGRFDLKAELSQDLPYTLHHADILARFLAKTLAPTEPKKGIISDLDDTVWSGIAGEVGAEGVSWDVGSHTQLHGLYQKLLSSLSEQGILVGIASKNDPAVVNQAFARPDILLRPERVFPLEVHWNAKSGSVQRILETWNVGADSVIFIDDSPMELAEVAAAHAGIECILFPKDDPAAGFAMLRRIRDLCGREQISQDDKIRLESIRQGAAFRSQSSEGASPEEFLRQAGATIVFDGSAGLNPRVLELVNKTNQFNLNGTRYLPAEWQRSVAAEGALVWAINYDDRFGPLGTVSVIQGVVEAAVLRVSTWVLSCRAFARRIEHRSVRQLFESTGVEAIEFAFRSTPKNGPVQDFFASFFEGKPDPGGSPLLLTRALFESRCPPLYQEVRVTKGIENI